MTKRAVLVGLASAGLLLALGDGAIAAGPVDSAKYAPPSCASASAPDSADLRACAGIAADLVIRHKGDPVCFTGRSCAFDIVLSNQSNTAFSGEIKLTDFLSFVPPLDVTAVVTLPPELACKTPPASTSPHECVADIALNPWEERVYRLSLDFTVVVPAIFRLDAQSCATLSAASFAAADLLPQQPLQPFSGRRYSCRHLALIVIDAATAAVLDANGSGIGMASGPVSSAAGGSSGECRVLQVPAADGQPAACPVAAPRTKRCADGRIVALDTVCMKTCPDGSSVPENAGCAARTKRCADGRYVPIDAVCQKQCPDGSFMAETAACPPQTKQCADGRYVPVNAACMKACPDGSYVAESAACPPPTKQCADGRYVPVNAVCQKQCSDGSYVAESAACPPQTKQCADGRYVPVNAVCMKACPDGAYMAETAACPPPTKRCADGRNVPVSAACQKQCSDGSYVAESAACPPPMKRCADGRSVPVNAVCLKTCPDGSYVPETAACPPPMKRCADGRYVPVHAVCLKACPDGTNVPESAACPAHCPNGMVGTPPYCRCPRGMTGPRCDRPIRY